MWAQSSPWFLKKSKIRRQTLEPSEEGTSPEGSRISIHSVPTYLKKKLPNAPGERTYLSPTNAHIRH
jgi:hypothetical protein